MSLFDNSSPIAVRRPAFEVSFGSSSGQERGDFLGPVEGAVGVGVGSADPWKQSLVSIAMEAGLAPCVDVASVLVSADDQAPPVAIDDEGSIALGYEDSSTELVFTASVQDVRYFMQGVTRITAVNGGAILSKLRINQSYEQQKAGDIVSDLLSQAGVESETIEDGMDFPFYVIDDRQNAYRHIETLANKSGYVAYFTPEGKLYCGPFLDGEPVQTFSFGMDIIQLQMSEATPVVGSVTAIGEGAAGSQGQEAWSWLVKDPGSVTAETGEGDSQRLLSDPSLRSVEAAQTTAEGVANEAVMMALTGRLIVPGAPAVAVGSTIEIADAPQDSLNGICIARRVRHQYSKLHGFISVIDCCKSANGGPGGALEGLL